MSEKYIQRTKDEEYYKNIIEEQKKALKITNKRVREQSKELSKLRHDNVVLLHTLKRVKSSLTEPNWKYLTNIQIKENMQKILKFFETPIGLVVLGAVLPSVPNFLKELGKMFRDFIKWCGIKICKLSKFIYQQICENLREIDFQAFSGNISLKGNPLKIFCMYHLNGYFKNEKHCYEKKNTFHKRVILKIFK